jgi:hypothetical protein
MTTSAVQSTTPSEVPQPLGAQTVLTLLGLWLAVMLALGASGIFLGAPGRPPLTVFAAAVTPLIVFAIALRVVPAFREFVLTLDMRMIVAIQAWRYAGLGFIALAVNHVLPGLFAWPAGVGDMAIGIAAPVWILTIVKNADAVATARFRLWNAFGILDFVIAFTTATICAMTITDPATPSIAPLGQLPLVLIPTFMVPLFVMLHIAALMQSKRAEAKAM